MKTRKAYYTSIKNPFVWVSILCIAASCVWSTVYSKTEYGMWLGVLLPIISAAWYTLILTLKAHRHVYKIAVPAGLLMLTLAARMLISDRSYPVGYIAMYIVIAMMFTWTISGRGFARKWLAMIFMIPIAALVCEMKMAGRDVKILIPELCVFTGLFSLTLALRRYADDGTYYPTWGDRVDGRKIRSLAPYYYMIPYIMKTRNTSSNFIRDQIEVSKVDAYIRQKRKEGYAGFGITHVLIAAYVRTVSQYPGFNRFINGQKIFSRTTGIWINMAIKKDMSTESPDTTVKMYFEPTDTIDDVYKEISKKFAEAKKPTLDSGFDNLARALNYIPGLLLRGVVALLQLLDYFGLLPLWIMKLSPFHGSMFITSMASLGIPPIYHHLYDFGNVPIFLAFGIKRRVNEVVDEGRVVKRQYIDYTFVTDERICDGFYYASGLKYLKKIIANPEVLDNPPEKVVKDVD